MKRANHVNPTELRRDSKGAYFVACAYGWHPGIPKNSDECLLKQCHHAVKIYMNHKVVENQRIYEHPACHGLEWEI